jgi:hypothetical protein
VNVVTDEELPAVASELRFAGHTLKMVFREKSIAIYARSRPNSEPHEYELIVIQHRRQKQLPSGAIVPEREGYPSNSEWGRFGWSFPVREREFVFGLARTMAKMDGPLGAWVREQITLYRQTSAFPKVKGQRTP